MAEHPHSCCRCLTHAALLAGNGAVKAFGLVDLDDLGHPLAAQSKSACDFSALYSITEVNDAAAAKLQPGFRSGLATVESSGRFNFVINLSCIA